MDRVARNSPAAAPATSRALMAPQRNRRQGATLRLQHQHQFGHAQPAAAHIGVEQQGMQSGLHHLAPQIGIVRLATPIEGSQSRIVALFRKEPARHVGDGGLILVNVEIHCRFLNPLRETGHVELGEGSGNSSQPPALFN